MAIAEVGAGSQRGTGSGSNVDSGTIAFPGNVTAGNLLMVYIGNWHATATTSITLSDTRSSSWTTILDPTGVAWGGGTGKAAIGYAIAPSSGACTVTIDPDGTSNYFRASCDEFSGVDTGTPLDVDGGGTTGTDAPGGDSLVTVANDDLVIGVMVLGNSWTSLGAGSGYTLIDSQASTLIQPYASEFQIVSGAGAQTADFPGVYTGVSWSAISAAFKPAGAVDPVPGYMAAINAALINQGVVGRIFR